jgi:hypothetical protein
MIVGLVHNESPAVDILFPITRKAVAAMLTTPVPRTISAGLRYVAEFLASQRKSATF